VVKLKAVCDDYAKQNPYGGPVSLGGWGGSGGVVSFATTNYYAKNTFPI
jgi:endoglucanase